MSSPVHKCLFCFKIFRVPFIIRIAELTNHFAVDWWANVNRDTLAFHCASVLTGSVFSNREVFYHMSNKGIAFHWHCKLQRSTKT